VTAGEQAIRVNGDDLKVPCGCTVQDLLVRLECRSRRVAVALNRDIVPRSAFGSTPLTEGDRVEILEAVGGG